jgi:glycosyltransferase 2 family protein
VSDGASAPPSKPLSKPRIGRVVAWIGGAAVVAAALWTLNGQWSAAREVAATVHPQWGLILLASAIVFAAYAILIVTWRACVADAGSPLDLVDSARIWFVSNLARYIPGALWQMGALAVMAKERGASASAATSAALVLTVVNTLAGLALAVVFLPAIQLPNLTLPMWAPIVIGVGSLAALRWFGPPVVKWVAGRTGLALQLPGMGLQLIAISTLGSVASWIAYGVAFKFLVDATVPGVIIAFGPAIAIYVGSYLAGFLSLGPPAGLGVADGAMVWLLTGSGIASPAEAVVIAACTRLWRTALEIAPGLVFLALQRSRGSRIP